MMQLFGNSAGFFARRYPVFPLQILLFKIFFVFGLVTFIFQAPVTCIPVLLV